MRNLVIFTVLFSTTFSFAAKDLVCQSGKDKAWVKKQNTALQNSFLFKYAVALFGRATTCEGKVTAVFEGGKFGEMRYEFKKVAVLYSESSPPESSVEKLEAIGGFKNEIEVVEKLKKSIDEIGLKINWSKSETTKIGQDEIKTYWDTQEGTNGRIFMTYRKSKLTAIGYGMAL